MEPLIPAITVKAALDGFAELGMDPAEMMAAVGLAADQLEDPFGSVPNGQYDHLWAQAFMRDPSPTLPSRAGMAVPFGAFGIVDHLVASADSIGEGLQMLSLFLRLVSTNLTMRFDHTPEDWVWVRNEPCDKSAAIAEEWTLAVVTQRFRQRIPAFQIERVHLAERVDSDAAAFEAVWGVPVQLGQAASGIQLLPGVWGSPNEGADPALRETLQAVAERLEVKQFDEAPLVYVIRTRLPEALETQRFSAADIAAELGLSRRTLHRHLAADGVTFQELLDAYRQEQAITMLQEGRQSMVEIAYALGYNEQSSFNRAFRRWTGQSPSAWLKNRMTPLL